MARKSKLLTALDAHRGRDYQAEKQKKLQKKATKRKTERLEDQNGAPGLQTDQSRIANGIPKLSEESEGWESDENNESSEMVSSDHPYHGNVGILILQQLDISRIDDSDSDSDSPIVEEDPLPQLKTKASILRNSIRSSPSSKPVANAPNPPASAPAPEDGDNAEEAEEDVPLSDLSSLASSTAEDLIPHQRLTINNLPALRNALASISLPYATLSFSDHQTVIAPSDTSILDINDDLSREQAFYNQSLHAATAARDVLQSEGVPFSRPSDYFAEMVKSDEHMGKVKQRLIDDASARKASEDAKKLRNAKKFGKAVQVAKEQERAKEKRATLDKIEAVKRKRKRDGASGGGEREDEELFDVEMEEAGKEERMRRRREGGGARGGRDGPEGGRSAKRQKKDSRFGFGGKKRFAKSGDAVSSGDLRGFSAGKMKGKERSGPGGQGVKKGRMKKPRLGKSKRAKVK